MIPSWLTELAARASAADASPPFSDQSLIDLDAGSRELLGEDGIGAAVFNALEFELVIDPTVRRRGHGAALLERVLASAAAPSLAWSHGDHPGARALADRFGFRPVRTLLQLRAPLTSSAGRVPAQRVHRDHVNPELDTPSSASQMKEIFDIPVPDAGDDRTAARNLLHLAPFRAGRDDAAWLDLNARAFVQHPEQGKLSQRDLDARRAEAWFNADDFLLLFEGDELVGSNWLKIDPAEPAIGEIYAIGVAPEHQGKGFSRILMDAGLTRLRKRGATTAALYVEADNEPALALYERYGFTRHTIDVQYSRT